ncbi:hypothetical protein [Leptospira stimsonii]|uniref:Uncharacterized protein n=1 Tax=Leptospira stimsonii TaxID=2202203 RepID=A0A8B3CLE8_9LEPT|nr:hypothetical protein [Leptospira stimsonii]RHX84094.1 hypothetical protein DLM78_18590 [Leptospira stimsonii]
MKKPSVAFANSAEQNDLVALNILFTQWIQSVDSFVREEESSKKDSLDLNPTLWYKKRSLRFVRARAFLDNPQSITLEESFNCL